LYNISNSNNYKKLANIFKNTVSKLKYEFVWVLMKVNTMNLSVDKELFTRTTVEENTLFTEERSSKEKNNVQK
jgi:hypothetical protein